MRTQYVYVASSWRNVLYDGVIEVLKAARVPHYDFKNPAHGACGFRWSEIDEDWQRWTPEVYRQQLEHRRCGAGFSADMVALKACTHALLVLPCGRSAHLELGYAIGAGKETIIYLPDGVPFEPELMYKAATRMCLNMGEVLAALDIPN